MHCVTLSDAETYLVPRFKVAIGIRSEALVVNADCEVFSPTVHISQSPYTGAGPLLFLLPVCAVLHDREAQTPVAGFRPLIPKQQTTC